MLTHPHLSAGCTGPRGRLSETPGSSFPRQAQVYIPALAPAAPSWAHETLRSQGTPALLLPGAASPGLARSRSLDQMTRPLS